MSDKIPLFLLTALFFSLAAGPLAGFTVSPGVNLYLSDILLVLLETYLFFQYRTKKIKAPSGNLPKYFFLFILVALVSNIFTGVELNIYERIVSILYLLRFCLYMGAFWTVRQLTVRKIISRDAILRSLAITGTGMAVLGWLQYFLYPDLRNLLYQGWDPHYMRIFSTYLDPNFFGLMMVLTVSVLLFSKHTRIKWLLIFAVTITLAFTYSRSSYLSLLVLAVSYSIYRRRFFQMLIVAGLFAGLLLFLPRPYGNESVKLERLFTINERIFRWKEAGTLFLRHPVWGVGFNTLRYVYKETGMGEISDAENHARAGVDNSFLFILVTTGTAGLAAFLLFLRKLLFSVSSIGKITFAAVFMHCLFSNSLFLPWVMLWISMTAAVEYGKGKDLNWG